MRLITGHHSRSAPSTCRAGTRSRSGGYHIREAGATAAQELAFTLRDGVEYVRDGISAGLDVDAFAPRMSFFFNAHSDFFEEIAKFRAARRIWARVMRDQFHAKNPRSWQLRFHTQTAGVSLTAQQPYNNVVARRCRRSRAVSAVPVAPHQCARRSAGAPDRRSCDTRAADAADHRPRDRRDRCRGSAGRLLFRREADQRPRRARRSPTSTRSTHGRHGGGDRARLPAAGNRRERLSFQQAVESREKIIVGVNDFVSRRRSDRSAFFT